LEASYADRLGSTLKGDGFRLALHQVLERQNVAQIGGGAGALLADGVPAVRQQVANNKMRFEAGQLDGIAGLDG